MSLKQPMKMPESWDHNLYRKYVNEYIDRVLKDKKCAACKKGFETARERDMALMVSGKPVRFVHYECKGDYKAKV